MLWKTTLACTCLLLMMGCGNGATNAGERQATATDTSKNLLTKLPEPRLEGDVSLEQTLKQRRSTREFSEQALTIEQIGQILWACQGITDPSGKRTAPSAGALYPLEVHVVTAEGVYHYLPEEHALEAQVLGDVREDLYATALKQEAIRDAPALIVISAVYERTTGKYGDIRGARYVHMEAGHAAQNVLLQAVALGLAAVPIGAFHDDEVGDVLRLPDDYEPIYLIPVGRGI